MEVLLGIVVGVALAWLGVFFFEKKKEKKIEKNQSIVLLERIKKVCKLITVEGEFAEIYQHENTKEHFLGLISSKKKALIIIKAKAHIGFDFKKLDMQINASTKTIRIMHFPEPEVFSIEPQVEYYDIKEGFFNKFDPQDLTALNKEAKQFILDKIPNSSLMTTAHKEAIEAVLSIESLVATIGWTLDYKHLALENKQYIQKDMSNPIGIDQ